VISSTSLKLHYCKSWNLWMAEVSLYPLLH